MSNYNYSTVPSGNSAQGQSVSELFIMGEQVIVNVLGVLTNLTIMFTMPFAKMNKRIKCMLTGLAFSDFGAVVTNSLISTSLTAIVPMFTHSPFVVSALNLSACKAVPFLADYFEACVQWTNAFLTMERFYVVYFPFKAAQLRLRTTVIIQMSIFLVCLCATSPHFAFYTVTTSGGMCAPANTDATTSMSYFTLRHLVFEHVVPPFTILTCNSLILLRLARRKNMHAGAPTSGEKKSGERSKLKMTITLVCISSLHLCGFVPCGIVCFIWYHFSNSPYAAQAWSNVTLAYSIYGIMHFANFIIYVVSMDAYRDVLKNPPVCTYKPKKK